MYIVRILLVEDHKPLARAVRQGMEEEGFAVDCAGDGVYEFFFCGPPLVITGGTGSPINPQAIK